MTEWSIYKFIGSTSIEPQIIEPIELSWQLDTELNIITGVGNAMHIAQE